MKIADKRSKEVKIIEKVIIRTLAKLIGKLEASLSGIQHFWYLHQSKNTALKKARENFDSICILDNIA